MLLPIIVNQGHSIECFACVFRSAATIVCLSIEHPIHAEGETVEYRHVKYTN